MRSQLKGVGLSSCRFLHGRRPTWMYTAHWLVALKDYAKSNNDDNIAVSKPGKRTTAVRNFHTFILLAILTVGVLMAGRWIAPSLFTSPSGALEKYWAFPALLCRCSDLQSLRSCSMGNRDHGIPAPRIERYRPGPSLGHGSSSCGLLTTFPVFDRSACLQ